MNSGVTGPGRQHLAGMSRLQDCPLGKFRAEHCAAPDFSNVSSTTFRAEKRGCRFRSEMFFPPSNFSGLWRQPSTSPIAKNPWFSPHFLPATRAETVSRSPSVFLLVKLAKPLQEHWERLQDRNLRSQGNLHSREVNIN